MKIFLTVALLLAPSLALADRVQVNVINVVDADTLDIEIPGDTDGWSEHRIRLDGLNAPESRSRCETDEQKATEREMAARAEDYVRERIEGAQRVEIDRQGEDGFNRPLGVVLLDGKSLNDDLLREGWALPYKPGTHGLQFCGDAQKGAYPRK